MPSAKKPLWTCPRCGHRFVTRNMWHSCTRYRIADHFKGKDPVVRHLYKQYVGIVRGFGSVTVFAQKTRIVFQARVRFAGAVVRKHWLEGGLWLKRLVALLARPTRWAGRSTSMPRQGAADRHPACLMSFDQQNRSLHRTRVLRLRGARTLSGA